MRKVWSFITGTTLIGFLALLPIYIIWRFFGWIFGMLAASVAPISEKIAEIFSLTKAETVIGVFVALILCFAVGLLLRTRVGGILHERVEGLLKKIPFYTVIRDVASLVFRRKKRMYLAFVSIEVFGGRLYGFLREVAASDGMVSVFFPSCPEPTKGIVLRFPEDCVRTEPMTTEEGWRFVLSAGEGFAEILSKTAVAKSTPA